VRFLSREQARELDRIAIEDLLIPSLLLMENAAIGIAGAARRLLPGAAGAVAVICGPGNNGGDGFAAARHLANAGAKVRIHLLVPPEVYREGSDAAVNLAIVRALRLPLRSDLDFGETDLLVDAIFGIGLAREPKDPYRSAIHAINSSGRPVVAVDVPSGLDANTGEPLGVAVRATVTATMAAPKVGFRLREGPLHTGQVTVVDMGIPPALIERVATAPPA